MALDDSDTISADEQAQMDAMRDADAQEGSDVTPAEPSTAPQADSAEEPAAEADPAAPKAEADPQQKIRDNLNAALHEERERRKESEHRAKLLEERTNLILQRFNQQQEQPRVEAPKPPPTLDEDPVGHIVGQQTLQGQALQQVAQLLQQRDQQDKRAAEITNIQQTAIAMEQEYRAETPDYDAAVAHLLASQERELLIAGFADPVQRRQVLSEQALGTVARALQRGKNPAETIYELATARGYTAAKPEPAKEAAAGDKIGQIAAGQQQRSIGQARGSGPAPMNANRLLEMDNKKFLEFMDTIEGQDLMGH